MKRLCISLAIMLALSLAGSAQIYTPGANNPDVKWSTISTPAYRIIYPKGMDSLAVTYAVSLEKYRGLEAFGCGFAPNEKYTKPQVVVLHPFTALSNGMVSWAPRGMHLFTIPEAYDPESTPWVDQLAVHESRHVSQMQLGKATPGFRFMNLLFGQLWPGAVAGIYPGPAMLEGDAVVAETALGKSGRGRTADFLEYYRVCFADSLYRDWYQWRWGSQKRYTPDYYAAGYMLNSGMRAFYGDNFFSHYSSRIQRKGLPLMNLQKTVHEASGKSFKSTFREIQDNLTGIWAADEAKRGPFIDGEAITSPGRLYDQYISLVFADDDLYAIHSGLACNRELVWIDKAGRSNHTSWFSRQASRVVYSDSLKAFLWTEYKPDVRWENQSSSVLKARGADGKVRTVARGAKYFNPAPDPASQDIAVVQYYEDGAASVAVLDGKTGKKILEYPAPDGVQPVEPVWTKDGVFVSGISDEGYTIYRISSVDGAFSRRLGWAPLFPAAHAKINRLFGRDGLIWFTSDMNGVNNLYSVDPADGTVLQRSNTRFGGNEFAFSPEGDLYYSAPRVKTREIRKIAADSLLALTVKFEAPFHPVAEAMSAMEPAQPEKAFSTTVSKPRPYSKLSLPGIHSWFPMYVDMDIASTLTYDETVYSGGLGATALFQNDLGTTWGSLGVSMSSHDPLVHESHEWITRPSVHAQLVFSGLPVMLELRGDINERDAHLYELPVNLSNTENPIGDVTEKLKAGPFASVSAAAYVPMDFSSGGWKRGGLLSLKGVFSNDLADSFSTKNQLYTGLYMRRRSVGFVSASATGYATLPIMPSCMYPKLGFGAGLSYLYPGVQAETYPFTKFDSRWGCKAYGYIPGFMDTHGIRLGADYKQITGSEWVNGYSLNLSANYAFPFAPVDWSFLGPIAYIRNFEGILHADYRIEAMSAIQTNDRATLSRTRLGATVQVRLSNWLWTPADARIGVRAMYDVTRPGDSFTELVMSTDLF